MTETQQTEGGEDRESLLGCLQESITRVRDDLAQVTQLRHVPQTEAIEALMQNCEKVRLLLPQLRALPAPYEYNILMRIDNLPDPLTRLEIEAQLLSNPEGGPLFPTRPLLEQQANVKEKGQQVLDELTTVLSLLQMRQEGVLHLDNDFQGSFKAHRRPRWQQKIVLGLLILPGSALIALSIACAVGIWRPDSDQLLLALLGTIGSATVGVGLLLLSMNSHKE